MAVGPEADILASYAADQIMDCQGKVVMPGLINAHEHPLMFGADYQQVHLANSSAFLSIKKRVVYYVMGAEKWKYADNLDQITRKRQRYYLHSNGDTNDVFHSGSMSAKPIKDSKTDSYIYNPLDKRPAELEREEIKDYLTDQTYDLNLFGNGLVYHTDAFFHDSEITRLDQVRDMDVT